MNDLSLLSKIRQETLAAFDQDGSLNIKHLMDSCPWTSAVFYEALRCYSASSSIRLVTVPTVIGGKLLPTGSRVMVPFRQMLLDPNAFGVDVGVFNPERFIRDKRLAGSASYRPFGGGSSYCPGRFIARQECVVFIALLFSKYDVEVGGERKVPQLDIGKPTTGLMSPCEGEDVVLLLAPRPDGGNMGKSRR